MNKFCKDCKWAKREKLFDDLRCQHPKVIETEIDWVYGEVKRYGMRCSSQRQDLSYTKCHPEGTLWEAKS